MDDTVDTMGWHTVAAVTYADVNKAIESKGSAPESFDQSAPDGTASANGTFGGWRLALGGAGPLLKLEIEVTGGSVRVTGQTPETRAVQPCSFPVEVRADFFPQPVATSVRELRLKAGQAVVVSDPIPPSPTGGFLHDAVLKEMLQQWLTDNLSEFNALFATVNMDADYVNEGLSWLRPSHTGYAVAEPASLPSLENSVFAVLCLIDGETPPSNLSFAVSHLAIPDGADAAFLISPEKFLQHMLLPAMPSMFKDIPQAEVGSHFTIDNDGRRIRNTREVSLVDIQFPWGPLGQKTSTKNPTVAPSKFSISVNESELILDAQEMKFDWGLDQWVTLNFNVPFTIGLRDDTNMLNVVSGHKRGGGQVSQGWLRIGTEVGVIAVGVIMGGIGAFGGKATAVAEVAADSAISAGVVEGETAVAIEAATSAALQTVETGEALASNGILAFLRGKVLVGFGAAVCGVGAIPAIGSKIAGGMFSDEVLQIDQLTDAAVGNTVVWPHDVGGFALDSAALRDALQFGLVRKP